MTEKKNNSAPKGDFIDLEEGQYKKKSYSKKSIFIIFIILIFILLSYFFFEKFNSLNEFVGSYKGIVEKKKDQEPQEIENKIIEIDKKKIENLNQKIIEIYDELFENKLKISNSDVLISDLNKKIRILENQRNVNSDFFYAERYRVLNDLLNLKNKFYRRVSFDIELERLISRFNNQPDIKSLIIFLQDIELNEIKKESDLLDTINSKINFYQEDLYDFIDSNFNNEFSNQEDIFKSKENFINYLKELFNSTYKITKIKETESEDKNKNKNRAQHVNESKLVKSLILAKEYLILGDLNKSIQVLSESFFNDNAIDKWITDAKILIETREKLKTLEVKLLNDIGSEVD